MVHRMLLVKVGSKYVHLLKMFGALFSFACAFYVFSAAYQLNMEMKSASLVAGPSTAGDVLGALTGPIAALFFWLAMFVLGVALYRSDRTIFPFEEDFEDIPEPKKPKKRK
jgi:hypothetical protein